MTTAPPLPPSLITVFTDLTSPHKETKARAGQELLNHVNLAYRELQPEKFLEYYNALNQRIGWQVVTANNDPRDRIAGITAIEALIPFAGDDAAQKTTRFSGFLRAGIRAADTDVQVRASEATGLLATPGGALTAELVDSNVKEALEWLSSERHEGRRFAATLLLRELAKNSPTLLYTYVPQIFECIWVAIRDIKVMIRETAAEAVGRCFEILLARDSRLRSSWLTRMWNEALQGFKGQNTTEVVHGSLLVVKELLSHGGMFMYDRHKQACDIVLGLRAHKEPRIRTEVVYIIPKLASYAPTEFCEGYIHNFMSFLSGQLKREKERSVAFIAIGKIATAVGSSIGPYLDGILVSVRDGLSYRAKSRTKDGSVFNCISMLAVAVGQTLTKYMEALMDPMFACGLSDALTQALVDMAHYVPPIKGQIQEKLLDLISLVLCNRPFRPLGCPEDRLPPMPAFAREWQQNGIVHGDAEIASALQTLGSFDFKGHMLNEFVRDVALKFIKNARPEIRKAAALTCCQIYVQDPIIQQTSFHAIGVVRQVISQLLSAAIGDPVPDIRKTILNALDTKFDKHLAEQDNIRKIILAVNESDFEVRKAAMQILGRLIEVNPAYVFPPLRKLLQNFTMGIWASHDAIFEEEAARLVSLCAQNASELVKPFVNRLVRIFLPKTTDPNPAVAATVLRAVGDLSILAGTEMKPYIPQLMPVIIEALQDHSSPNKRDAALQALGQLASNSGYVIAPYIDHPQLLDILTTIIKTEQQGSLRRETIKLLGILGALDPYKHQQSLEQGSEVVSQDTQPVSDVALIMQGLTPSSEEYYPTVVMNTLMNNVLRDNSLSQYHGAVIEAIVSIFKTMGLKCVPFLGQIIPTFITVIQSAPLTKLEQYFNQLAILVAIVREHIRPFNKDLVKLVQEFWDSSPSVQVTTLALVEALARSLKKEFYPSVVKLLPYMMGVLDKEGAFRSSSAQRIMHTLLIFGQHAAQSMWLMVPKLVKGFMNAQKQAAVRKGCIETIDSMARQTNISDYSSQLIQGLVDVLGTGEKPIRAAAYTCILTLIFEYPSDIEPFLDGIKLELQAHNIPHTSFDTVCARVRSGESLPQDLRPAVTLQTSEEINYADITQRKLPVNQEHLKGSWEASQKSTKEDWMEWMRRFSVELLKESPSNALRACAGLASVFQPLAKDLFNAAFVSCWTELYDQYQEELVHSLELALHSPQLPPEILQVLLNLAEFMEHDDKPLPIDIGTLGSYAYRCHAYAKALHYKELEFEEEKTPSVVEALISINNQLQQTDAAVGILRNAQKYRDIELKETWFEKLGRWDEALQAYQNRDKEANVPFEVTHGKMRCLHALGEWEALSNLAQDKWNLSSMEHKRKIAPLAAGAAWGLGQWELMDNYLEAMKLASPDRSFFGAIAALHQDHFQEAKNHIEHAREGLDTELSALLGESYTRAYGVVVRVQMLAELEEIIAYKKASGNPEKQETMRETWRKRLLGCEGNVETWQRMLKVRQLVLQPKENIDLWIKFANLCRKSGRAGIAEKTIKQLETLVPEQGGSVLTEFTGIPEVTYAQKKYEWSNGDKNMAISGLREFTDDLSDKCNNLNVEIQNSEQNPPNPMNVFHQNRPAEIRAKKEEIARVKLLLSKCYLKIGQWETQISGGNWRSEEVQEILLAYQAATQYNPAGYKAWHAWALANFEVVNALSSRQTQESSQFPSATVSNHVIPAIRGFFKSISLSQTKSKLQDTLRLLTLWFAHGSNQEVVSAMQDGIPLVSNDTWLEVIPQLIARINQPVARVRTGVHNLLCQVGKVHPQALVFPLTVAMKSETKPRADSARAVMDQLRHHSQELVDQAQLVSKELIRVAVLWHELWHEGLEEASRLYFGDHNTEAMFKTLAPLHKLLEDGPHTLREISFMQTFGRELTEAQQWGETFRRTGELGDINQAWDLYYAVFKRISRQLPQLMTLDLKYISPLLKEARNLELAVPGTYQSGKPIVRITSFDKIFTVIPSKQRPRKMTLKGSDGTSYTYLLKGHEDIRQDERVMQLFGLVNTLLNNDTESFKRHLNIQKYPAIPLSQSSGLLGWVPNSDTLHNLIKDYRENRRILLNIEHRIMLQMAPDYDNLTLMQKVEVFSYAMDNTTGKDLYRVLWLKSRSSESWLERRTNYTRSLAVMSMVGYILGLGDRHPSNLMLDRITGKVIHIDFGDCFEIAMHREKYPERVPFRLTRMLTFAMEVSNIDGSYKISSEAVMRVIRENKESLMAVLEAFIHDPLLNWRLNTRESPNEPGFISERRESLMMSSEQPPVAPHRRGSLAGELEAAQISGSSRPSQGSIRGRGRSSTLQQVEQEPREAQNARALQVLARVKEKLNGLDFRTERPLDVEEQVARLIAQATNIENICQHYIGWCSFW